jgi:hypothetical protein
MEAQVIVKVQRPLAGSPTTKDMPDTMVYAQGREHQVLVHLHHLPPWLRKALVTTPKTFAYAEWSGAGWHIKGPAEWQEW